MYRTEIATSSNHGLRARYIFMSKSLSRRLFATYGLYWTEKHTSLNQIHQKHEPSLSQTNLLKPSLITKHNPKHFHACMIWYNINGSSERNVTKTVISFYPSLWCIRFEIESVFSMLRLKLNITYHFCVYEFSGCLFVSRLFTPTSSLFLWVEDDATEAFIHIMFAVRDV